MANTDASRVIIFEIYRDSALVQRADFTEASITIGTGDSALLKVEDEAIAELHAVVNVEDDGSVSLHDLGSENGVKVNGEKITIANLRSGDDFHIGGLRFSLQVDSANDDADDFDDQDATYVAPSMEALRQMAADEDAGEAEATLVDEEDASAEEEEEEGEEEDDHTEDEPAPNPNGLTYDEAGLEVIPELGIDSASEWISANAESEGGLGNDAKRPSVLEINQVWGDTLLDTKHFTRRSLGRDVSIGSRMGYKWHFLGVDMGWVPDSLRYVLPYTPPMWSEVNSDWRNDFYAPEDALPSGEHTLMKHDEESESYTAVVQAGWEGYAERDDKRYTFDELVEAGHASKSGEGYTIPMVDNQRLMVDIGGVAFYTSLVQPGARLLNRNSEDIDYPFLAIGSVITFIGFMFGVVMFFSPKPAENELVDIPDRFVELLLEKPEEEPKKEKKPDSNPDAGEGAKAKKEEGKVGKKDAKMQKAKGNKVEVKKKELDRQIAENAGVLGALRDAGDLDGMFGSSGLDANLTGGIGGLIGAKGTQIGSGGLGARGSGLGGGGSAEGLGGLGTKGIGSGRSGYGSGGGSFGDKAKGGIGKVGGDPIILGALDRSLIDEVIKRHMNQIRYCYQRELTKNPSLAGKVVIKFVIAKDGTVSSASVKSSTMGNPGVESCISGRFMRMQFPEPKGGGIVIVSYPFLFSPG